MPDNKNYNVVDDELDWNDVITVDDEYVILDPGVYDYSVCECQKARSKGSETSGACNMMVVTVQIDGPDNRPVLVKSNLLLRKKFEWKISQFFTSIGMKKHGEALSMDWENCIGRTGKLRLKNREYNGNTYNEVDRFLPKEAPAFVPGQF